MMHLRMNLTSLLLMRSQEKWKDQLVEVPSLKLTLISTGRPMALLQLNSLLRLNPLSNRQLHPSASSRLPDSTTTQISEFYFNSN